MKKQKIIIISLIFIIIIGISVIFINLINKEKTKYTVILEGNKEIEQGEILELYIKIKDIKINTGEKGIGAYQGKIEYDTNIFENIVFEGIDDWETPYEENGKFTAVRKDGLCVKEDQYVAKIRLKVKENIKNRETYVKIINFKVSDAQNSIPIEEINDLIKIK